MQPEQQQTPPQEAQTPQPQQPFQPEQAPSPPISPAPLSPPPPEKKSHKKMWIIISASIVAVLLLLTVVVVIFMNAVQKSNDDFTRGNSIEGLKNYTDSDSGVSLKIPSGWNVKKTKPDDATIVRLTIDPPADSFANAFDQRQTIDLVCQKTSKSMTEQSFANAVKTGVLPGEEAKGLTVTNQSETKVGNLPAYRYDASGQTDKSRTTYYHSYYMAGTETVCDMYVLAVVGTAGETLPVEAHVSEILGSFRYSSKN